MRVTKDQVMKGTLTEIAKGAVGQVYRLTGANIPGLTEPLAYKEILATVTPEVRAEAVHSMEQTVALREAMSQADRAELDRMTTWPVATVEDKGVTIGTLMPLIPPEFFITLTPPKSPSKEAVFAFAFLSASETYVQRMGIDRKGANDPLARLSLAANLAFAIGLLHKHKIVYGDLSLQNVAISVSGVPKIKLLDCDAAAALSDAKRHQMHSPHFKPPENNSGAQKEQDLLTDVYKLGLCVLRGLVTGPGVTQLVDPNALRSALDQEGVDLVTRALSTNRGDRPSAKDLCLYLERAVLAQAQPPVIHSAQLNRRVMVRGQDVLVTWSGENLRHLRITGTNGLSEPVGDPSAHQLGYAITPAKSGPIVVEATNKHGTVSVDAGYIDLYELPKFEMAKMDLPRPTIPRLEPVVIPEALSALPARPMVTADTHPVPRITAPDLTSMYDAMHARLVDDPVRRLVDSAAGPARTLGGAGRDARDQAGVLIGALSTTVGAAHDAVRDAMRNAMRDVSADLQRWLADNPLDYANTVHPPGQPPAGAGP